MLIAFVASMREPFAVKVAVAPGPTFNAAKCCVALNVVAALA